MTATNTTPATARAAVTADMTAAQQLSALRSLLSTLETERTAAIADKHKSRAKYARHRIRVAKSRIAALETEIADKKSQRAPAKPKSKPAPVETPAAA